jgi:hypothetical protein
MPFTEKTGPPNAGKGRPKGALNKATAEVRGLAREYGPDALKELHRLSNEAESEAARVSACNAILDRAYGKSSASVPIVIDIPEAETPADVSKAVAAVIRAASEGKISPADASAICSLLETQRRAIETTELEQRLAMLEGKI